MMHNPGGKSLYPLKPGVTGDAYITDDGVHRLWLSRVWGPGARYVMFAGMNPSAAKPDMDDPTIIRDCGFAQRWGYNGYFKVNYATYRARDPKQLLRRDIMLSHAENLHCIQKIAGRCSRVVLAYGVVHPAHRALVDDMLRVIREVKTEIYCLGRTQSGDPRHSLYLRSDTPPELFR